MKEEQTLQNTEEIILLTARRLFLKKGFEATSMADIAREAGINRTLLNYYFRTKERLFEGIFRDVLKYLLPSLQGIVVGDADIFKKMELIIDLYTSILSKSPDIALFAANEASRDPEHFFSVLKADASYIDMFKKIHGEILKSMDNGTLRKMPIEYFATTFLGMVVFPFVGKNIITGVFFNSNESKFLSFVNERKKFVLESLRKIFDPNVI